MMKPSRIGSFEIGAILPYDSQPCAAQCPFMMFSRRASLNLSVQTPKASREHYDDARQGTGTFNTSP